MPTLEQLRVGHVRATITTFRDAVRAHQASINRLNVYPVPDGDTGTNMARTLDAVVDELAQLAPTTDADLASDADMAATCRAISHGSLMGARGNSGVILSQILRGIASTIEQGVAQGLPVDGAVLARAFAAASTAAYSAVLKPVEGTILTVVRETAEAAQAAVAAGSNLLAVLDAARAAGQRSLARTPELLPVLRDAGVVDAGGAGFLFLLDAVLHVVDGRPLPEPTELDELAAHATTIDAHLAGEVSDLRYEVMYFLDLADDRIDRFKHAWGAIGDSIVVVGGEGLFNCHIHTNDIGAAVEVALELDGRPRKIRVTDLFEEVTEEHSRREASMHGPEGVPHAPFAVGLPEVTTAVVAVAVGDGLARLFGQLGVQQVVAGGQTMNPSTAELLAAVDACNAESVIILPNNKNIIPVAQQVDALSSKRVWVVPTTSMPEALAALVVYDPEGPADGNAGAMGAAAAAVTCGEVTRAVREAASPAGPVSPGDYIGLVRGEGIAVVHSDLVSAATALLDHIVGPGAEIVTVIEGEGVEPETRGAIEAWLAEHRDGVEIEVHRGGQPLYPFLFGVE